VPSRTPRRGTKQRELQLAARAGPDTRQRWLRLRWGGATPLAFNATTGALENISAVQVERLSIVFDEGQDVGPDNFGLAVLDNIDVNGRLVGQGPGPKSGNEDK
jgi:hypothetical protein